MLILTVPNHPLDLMTTPLSLRRHRSASRSQIRRLEIQFIEIILEIINEKRP